MIESACDKMKCNGSKRFVNRTGSLPVAKIAEGKKRGEGEDKSNP